MGVEKRKEERTEAAGVLKLSHNTSTFFRESPEHLRKVLTFENAAISLCQPTWDSVENQHFHSGRTSR